MNPATVNPPPEPRFENPCPFRFNLEQYRRLGELGFYGNVRVELLDGVVFEKYPDDSLEPSPRPFRFTREQFYRMGELGYFDGRRVELVRGEIVVMSPISEPHVTSVSLATNALKAAFGPNHFVRVQAPLNLGTIDPEPDVAVVPGGPRDYAAPPTTALLVVEVADTSFHYDTTTKAEEYATAGIPDYWVIDLAGRQLHVYRDPVHAPTLGTTTYRTHTVLGPSDTVSPLHAPHASVTVADLLP
jgi:Uma2 family endonuclease